MREIKLGSLFDGSGGFPLAGSLYGIRPVWASEIEPFPIRVTKQRFPEMKHLGSVTEVNGAEIEPVDIITFGSPCQDLSIAGAQAGIIDGERSNLFFEAIRVIREMRGVSANKYPRFAVWENVPGAFSSNKGADFQSVLEAICRVKEPNVSIPKPAGGGWKPAGLIVGDGYSIAWRVYDAQYWGVPQRRKRIYLIADFGSERAGEILFESESVSGDSKQSKKAWKETAENASGSTGRSIVLNDQGGAVMNISNIAGCLRAQEHGHQPIVAYEPMSAMAPLPDTCISIEGNGARASHHGPGFTNSGICYSLNTVERHSICYRPKGNRCGIICGDGTSETLQAKHPIAVYEPKSLKEENWTERKVLNALRAKESKSARCCVYGVENHAQNGRIKLQTQDKPCQTLTSNMDTGGEDVPILREDLGKSWDGSDIIGTLTTRSAGCNVRMPDKGNFGAVIQTAKPPKKYIIRRLTPVECGRLQGFPDWWCDGANGSDSAMYKMWGNGIALPCAADVLGRIAKELQTEEE